MEEIKKRFGCGFRSSPLSNMCGVGGLLCAECYHDQKLIKKKKDKITCELWEDNGYIICINNHPVGMTVTKRNGEVIKDWLNNRAGLSSIKKEFALSEQAEVKN